MSSLEIPLGQEVRVDTGAPDTLGTVQLCCKAALGDRSPVRMATTLLIDEVPGMWTLGALGFRESSTAGTAAHRTFFSFEQHRS